MRRYRLSICLAVALSALSFSAANALPFMCAVGTSVNNHARIMMHGKMLAQCAGNVGCKCVSCYALDGSVSSTCYPLVVAMPH